MGAEARGGALTARRRVATAALGAFLTTCVAASAVFPGAKAAEPDCTDPSTQTAMNLCAARDFEAADRRLNETYAELRKHSDAAVRSRLLKAQRAWIAYRDAQCDYETIESEGGSIHPLLLAECRRDLTQAQTKRLAERLRCEEAGSGC